MHSDIAVDYLARLLDAGCSIKNRTILFGKEYFWMKDPYGTFFLERVPENNLEDNWMSLGPFDIGDLSE